MAIKLEFNFNGSWEEHEAFITDLNTTEVLHKNLKPADSTAAAIMTPSVDLYNKLRGIVSAPIPARIMDGAVTKFTGYLRNNFTIGKTQRLQPVRVELVTASFLLKRKINKNLYYQNVNVSQLLVFLLNAAGITEMNIPAITSMVPAFSAISGESGTYHEHIEALLFQHGYIGYFNLTGVFVTHKLDPSSIITSQVFDGSNCRFEIRQSKTETQVDRVEVHWFSTTQLSNAVVFSDITNAKNGYSCFIELPAGTYLGDSPEWFAELDSPEGEILSVNDLSLKFNAEPGVQIIKFEQAGKRAIVSIRNTTALTKAVRRLDIVAGSAIVKKDLNKCWVPLNPDPQKIEVFQANYIFDKVSADNLANILGWYYRYSTFSYKVTSKTDYALGTIVVLTDAGIGTQTCLIVAKRTDLQTGEINYDLDAIAEYSPAAAEAENTNTQPTPSPSPVAKIINNDPPTNNVTALDFLASENPNGTVDVSISWKYTQGEIPADGFLVFYKKDIAAPGDIDIFNTTSRYVPASDVAEYRTQLNLPTRQAGAGTLPIRYRFGVLAFGTRSIGIVAHPAGVVEHQDWIDVTFASRLNINPMNFWDQDTGELMAGAGNGSLHVDPFRERVYAKQLYADQFRSDQSLLMYAGGFADLAANDMTIGTMVPAGARAWFFEESLADHFGVDNWTEKAGIDYATRYKFGDRSLTAASIYSDGVLRLDDAIHLRSTWTIEWFHYVARDENGGRKSMSIIDANCNEIRIDVGQESPARSNYADEYAIGYWTPYEHVNTSNVRISIRTDGFKVSEFMFPVKYFRYIAIVEEDDLSLRFHVDQASVTIQKPGWLGPGLASFEFQLKGSIEESIDSLLLYANEARTPAQCFASRDNEWGYGNIPTTNNMVLWAPGITHLNRIKAMRGRTPGGEIDTAAATTGEVYNALATALLEIGQSVLLHGSAAGNTAWKASRTDLLTIRIHHASGVLDVNNSSNGGSFRMAW
jgi:hypothetical protein